MSEGGAAVHTRGWRSGLVFVPALAAVVGTMLTTRQGMMLDPDSASYLRSAQLIRADPSVLLSPPSGDSLAVAGNFPPFYPVVLALTGTEVADLTPARWVTVALAGGSIALLTWLVRRHGSMAAAVSAGTLVVLTRGYLVRVHSFVMSDALFGFLALLALVLVDASSRALTSRRAMTWALAAALVAGLAATTRLVGMSVVAAVALAPLLFSSRRRWFVSLAAGATGLALPLAWLATVAGGDDLGPRSLGWYGFGLGYGGTILDSIQLFLLPQPVLTSPLGWCVDVMVIAGIGVVAWWALSRIRASIAAAATASQRCCGLLVSFAALDVLVLLASTVFADPLIYLEARHLMVVWIALIGAAAIDLAPAARKLFATPRPRAAFRMIAALAACSASIGLARSLVDPSTSAFTLTTSPGNPRWVALSRTVPPSEALYSDRPDLLYIDSGVVAGAVPVEFDPITLERNSEFLAEVRSMARDLESRGGMVILLGNDSRRHTSADRLVAAGGFQVVEQGADGAALVCDPVCRP